MKSIFVRGFLLSLILGGSSPALAEESLFFNGKNRISNPYIDRHSRASIDALHDGYFDIRSVNKGNFAPVEGNNLWKAISKYSRAYAMGRLNDYVQGYLESMPFVLHSSVGLDFASDSEANLSADVLFKALDFGNDESGDLLGLAFVHTKYKTHFDSGSTTNIGFGLRKRTSDFSMYGLNTYWDYRMTNYSSAHSRFGLGGEYFWKDFSFRNNWYMSGTGTKSITTGGSNYYERVVPGWDVEVGYRLPSNPNLAFYLKGFNWDYQKRNDNSGVQGTVSWQATPHLGINAWASNEIPANATSANSDLDNQQAMVVGIGFKLTANKVEYKPNYKANLIQEMKNPVRRRYDVLLERWSRSSSSFNNIAAGS